MSESNKEGVKVKLFAILHFLKQVRQEIFAENWVFFEQLYHVAEIIHWNFVHVLSNVVLVLGRILSELFQVVLTIAIDFDQFDNFVRGRVRKDV